MTIYGLFGITHGWGRVLTLMSPEGSSAVLRRIEGEGDVRLAAREGMLPQVHELRGGALETLVRRHGIIVLDRAQWADKKAELADDIWR